MIQALLFSNSANHGRKYLEHATDELLAFLGPCRRLLFVPFALFDRQGYAARVRASLEPLGIAVDELTADVAGRRSLRAAEAVFVGGGNTFRLLLALQQSGLLAPLRQRAFAGLPYVGSSAGSNIAGPTIRNTNDMPIVFPQGFEALGLVPFQMNPHYLDLDPNSIHMGETREERIREFHEEDDTPVVGLREGCWVRREGDDIRLGGASTTGRPAARIFRRGTEPEERVAGATLSDL